MQEPQNLPSIGGYSSNDKRQSEYGEDIVLNDNIQLTDRSSLDRDFGKTEENEKAIN